MLSAILKTNNAAGTAVGLIMLLIVGGTNIDQKNEPPNRTKNEAFAVDLIESLMKKSDSRVRPGVYGPPTNVTIDFFVQSFGPLNEVEMEFSTDLDFRQTWMDPRLAFSSETDDPVYIPHKNIDKFWIPDLYFPNEKEGIMHTITIPNQSIRIYPNGTVRYFCRMAMRLSCTMHLAKFPLDYQICFIKISTYSYDSKEVKLDWWDQEPIELHMGELQLPQFEMIKHVAEDCIETYKTGTFSCIQATFFLKRLVGFFYLQTFIPSILIVVLSWVGFWINKDSEPARIALGVTTVLTMTTQLTTSRSNTMRVSYLKAIDVWYSACMLFVFAALLEYAFVNASSRREKNLLNRAKKFDENKADDVEMQNLKDNDVTDGKTTAQTAMIPDESASSDGKIATWQRRLLFIWRWHCSSKSIDRFSRRFFPTFFILFNVIYWAYYLSPPHYHCNISTKTDGGCSTNEVEDLDGVVGTNEVEDK